MQKEKEFLFSLSQCFQNFLLEVLFITVCETNQMVNALALAVVERILWNAAKFDDAG